jgi:5'-3' exonuclease
MGISGLTKFLRDECPQVFHEINIRDLQYQKGAVDISLYVFKYITIFGDRWLTAILNLVSTLRKHNIHCCFIYDTSAPQEKMAERESRREKRDKLDDRITALQDALVVAHTSGRIEQILLDLHEKLEDKTKIKRLLRREEVVRAQAVDLDELKREVDRISKQSVHVQESDFLNSKALFQLLGVPFFNAAVEAETTCSDLCKQGKVDFVLSEDSDVLAYGAPMFVSRINTSSGTATVVYYEEVLSALEFTSDQFLDFCIMCGTDYNSNIRLIGPKKAFRLIREHGSIEAIAETGIDVSALNHTRGRELFLGYEKFTGRIPYCGQPDFQKLGEFLFRHNIGVSLDTVRKNFTEPDIVFEE